MAVAQRRQRRHQGLEALLVLHPAPRHDERRPAAPLGGDGRLPHAGVDAVGHHLHLVGRELEGAAAPRRACSAEQVMTVAAWKVSHHSTLLMAAGWPDGIAAAVAAPLGGVDGGHEGHAPQGPEVVAGPGGEPVVGVDDVGPPAVEGGDQLHQLVVGRAHPGQEVAVGQRRQVGVGPQHAHAVDDRVVGRVGVVEREHHDLVAGAGEGAREPVDVGGQAADDERRHLPADHGDPHGRRP